MSIFVEERLDEGEISLFDPTQRHLLPIAENNIRQATKHHVDKLQSMLIENCFPESLLLLQLGK